ncbi:MAG: RusA family crossover junction endodeoxyribonuclease [Symploca sp. SIO2D2]|nr:RusA family crossover junction endodeoxyribonuclease [Symploca sp. SIO2D2]
MVFEFLIPERPVSLQTKNRANLQDWKRFVACEAAKTWGNDAPIDSRDLQLTLVYLCGNDPVDIDNIIKPIQDALVGLVYADDILVTDVESRRRPLTGTYDVALCPELVLQGLASGDECVYVRVSAQPQLEDKL